MVRSSTAFARGVARIAPGLEQVEAAMRDQLVSESPIVRAVGDHVLSSGGKRLRPYLLFHAAELCGYAGPRRVQIAAAIEFLHTATLLHDDVVDRSDLRRGRPAARALWGNRQAVLVGDFFYARASSMVVEDGDRDVLEVFANTIRLMAEGELLQLERSFDADAGEAHYFRVIDRKSAGLLSAACEAGAILGGVTRAERRRLAEFGRELGLAFQLRDDALDYAASERELGKRPYTDLREGKVTLPLLLALGRCTAAERSAVEAVLKAAAAAGDDGGGEGVELGPLVALVERYRGVPDTVRRAEERAARAAAAIAPFPAGPAKEALLAATDFAVARSH